ncbi:MAG: hypothetical protein AMXMBFR7_27000 [Planctomycetota bacterium]
MPKQRFGGALLHADMAAMAAAYLFHLCKNHPFVDGYKRVALTVVDVFLRLNGYKLRGTDDELENLTLRVADGSISKEALTNYMRKHLKREAKGK